MGRLQHYFYITGMLVLLAASVGVWIGEVNWWQFLSILCLEQIAYGVNNQSRMMAISIMQSERIIHGLSEQESGEVDGK